jgi:hypothetical protein
LYERYQILLELYKHDAFIGDVDFAGRILILINRLSHEFEIMSQETGTQYLRAPQVTELVYRHDVPALRENLDEYIMTKNGIFILFDNIEKGWLARG